MQVDNIKRSHSAVWKVHLLDFLHRMTFRWTGSYLCDMKASKFSIKIVSKWKRLAQLVLGFPSLA